MVSFCLEREENNYPNHYGNYDMVISTSYRVK